MEEQRKKVNEKNKESHEIKSSQVTRSAIEEGKQNLLDDADSNIRNVGEWNFGGETNLIFGGETELHVGDGREWKQNIINEAELEFGDGMQANSMNDEELMVVVEEKQNVEEQLNINDNGDMKGGEEREIHAENDVERNSGNAVDSTEENKENKMRRGRKRQRKETEWKNNVRKRARNEGKQYISKKGKLVPARKITYHRCGRCVNRCNDVLPDEERDKIFHNYWRMGDKQRQRDFIANHISVKHVNKCRNEGSRRKNTMHYFFTVNNNKIKVCKAVFLKTLGIGEKTVTYTMAHTSQSGQASCEKRCTPPGIKKPQAVREAVKSHIASFPALESHYSRRGTSKKYLEKDLNIKKMHSMYLEKYEKDQIKLVKESYYRSVFVSEFNISFHKPKKDLCSYCFSYENSNQIEKDQKLADYNAHLDRKNKVRQLKVEYKELAKTDPEVVSLAFDFEQVLPCPRLNVSSLFYKRKLATFNLTTYELASKKVNCYMWHEAVAGRGSCEIATCIHMLLKSLPDQVNHVILFSDTCSGQNRNQYFASMCLNAVKERNIDCIDHIFMESGHSQMEVDSVHSCIETAVKNQNIYSPGDYYRIVSMARKRDPYSVKILSTKDFFDYKALGRSTLKNRSRDIMGNTVQWLKIKWLSYQKKTPNIIRFKYNYDEDFCEICVNKGVRGRPSNVPVPLESLFSAPPAISRAKYEDLMFLCNSLAIPQFYHDFYRGLTSDPDVRDALPEPDVTEMEEMEE
jgi:hypothetical protein